MAYTTQDCAEKAIQANPVRYGTVVCGCQPNGSGTIYTARNVSSPPTTAVESKYQSRLDDTTYYTA